MNEQELKDIAMKKIEKALSTELPAEVTAMYIQAFALLTANKCSCTESVKV